MQSTQSPQTLIYNIQSLRAFAALSVVFYHVSSPSALGLSTSFGNYGVDVFFVISGFIISQISYLDPSQFIMKRIIRLAPFYWAATISLFFFAYAAPSLVHSVSSDWGDLIASLLFFPAAAPAYPILGPGWTLNYEMYFYALFAVALTINTKYAALLCGVFVCAIFLIINGTNFHSPIIRFYGNPVVFEFLYGIGIFYTCRNLSMITKLARKIDAAFLALGASMIGAIGALPLREVLGWPIPPVLCSGVSAAIIVLAAIIFERRYLLAIRGRWAVLLGEASYVLYLINLYVIYVLIRVLFTGAQHWPEPIRWLFAGFLLGLITLIAVAIHVYSEAPIIKLLRRQLLHKSTPVIFQGENPVVP